MHATGPLLLFAHHESVRRWNDGPQFKFHSEWSECGNSELAQPSGAEGRRLLRYNRRESPSG